MYILVPLAAPLVLLGVMGMAWVEAHLLPPAQPLPPAGAMPTPARGAAAADPPGPPDRLGGTSS